jgi:hypothetical protein
MPLEVAILVRVHAAVDQEAPRAFELLDDPRAGGRLFHRQRLARERAGHERQHHAVGVGIEEHVLDELLGPEMLDLCHATSGGPRKAEEALATLRRVLEPLSAGIDEVALHIEDEVPAPNCARASIGSFAAWCVSMKAPPTLPAAA